MEKELSKKIIKHLIEKNIKANIKGFRYLFEAISITIENDGIMPSATKELYPTIAERFKDTPSNVERAMRHAIQVSGEKAKCNGEFISLCALEILFVE